MELINKKEIKGTNVFLLSEEITEKIDVFDRLELMNYILSDMLTEIKYNQETKQDEKDFKKLCNIKDDILNIYQRNLPKF